MDIVDIGSLLRELRAIFTHAVAIPRTLVEESDKIVKSSHTVAGRIRAYRELAALREIAKRISSLYFRKSDVIAELERAASHGEPIEAEYVLHVAEDVHSHIRRLRALLNKRYISDVALVRDAQILLSRADALYRNFLKAEQSDFLTFAPEIADVLRAIEQLEAEGRTLIEHLDNHRLLLDFTY